MTALLAAARVRAHSAARENANSGVRRRPINSFSQTCYDVTTFFPNEAGAHRLMFRSLRTGPAGAEVSSPGWTAPGDLVGPCYRDLQSRARPRRAEVGCRARPAALSKGGPPVAAPWLRTRALRGESRRGPVLPAIKARCTCPARQKLPGATPGRCSASRSSGFRRESRRVASAHPSAAVCCNTQAPG